jgi:hypothetical protein
LHAEDVGWPPKKTVKTINAKETNSNIVAVNFAPEAQASLAMAA